MSDRSSSKDSFYTIRNARPDDAGRIKELYIQLSGDVSNVARDFATLLNDLNARCFVLEVRGAAVGMVMSYTRPSLSSGKKLVIDDLVVDHRHRGQGFGSAMVQHCIDLAKTENMDCVEVACSRSKQELHRFYEKLGLKHRMRLYSLFFDHAQE